MAVTWKKGTHPNLITEQLEKIKIIDKDGKISFQGFDFNIFTTLIYNILDFSDEISEIDARNIVTRSVFNTASKKEITPKNLCYEINKLERHFWSLPLKRLVLVSKISISQMIKLNCIHIGNNRIIFNNFLPDKFNTKSRNELIDGASKSTPAKLPTNYSSLRVYVSSRSYQDAANQALDNINFIRGIWNWVLNCSFTFRKTYSGKPEPINKIILGPIHTLHFPDGKLAAPNQWWYEASYWSPVKPFYPNKRELGILYNTQNNIRKRINRLNYSKDIQSTLIRYASALDERDMTSAYVKLWGILEFLTNSNNYETLTRRVSRLYQEYEFHKQVLDILRSFRNSYVHSGQETNEIETYLIRLKNYVDSIIRFHILNEFHFNSIEKVAEFLDLPINEKEFKYKFNLYNYAKRFRHY